MEIKHLIKLAYFKYMKGIFVSIWWHWPVIYSRIIRNPTLSIILLIGNENGNDLSWLCALRWTGSDFVIFSCSIFIFIFIRMFIFIVELAILTAYSVQEIPNPIVVNTVKCKWSKDVIIIIYGKMVSVTNQTIRKFHVLLFGL